MSIEIEKLFETSHKLSGNCPGLYFLYEESELVYIGSGWNCLLRVAEHTRKESDKIFTSWNYLHIEKESEYKKLEKELIYKYSPKYNKQNIKKLTL